MSLVSSKEQQLQETLPDLNMLFIRRMRCTGAVQASPRINIKLKWKRFSKNDASTVKLSSCDVAWYIGYNDTTLVVIAIASNWKELIFCPLFFDKLCYTKLHLKYQFPNFVQHSIQVYSLIFQKFICQVTKLISLFVWFATVLKWRHLWLDI